MNDQDFPRGQHDLKVMTTGEAQRPMRIREILRRAQRALVPVILGMAVGLNVYSPAMAAPTLTYSEVRINSLSSVNDLAPDSLRDETGAEVQLGIAGSRAAAFSSGGAVVKQVTDDVFARSSLQTGTIKARATLQLGANTFTSGGGVPVGARNGAASATAIFADSFRAYSASTPFLWTSGTTATFQFGVTGQSTVTGTVPDPVDFSPGQPLDQIYTLLTIAIYKPGTLDLLRQLQNFDFSAYPDFATALAAFHALNDQIETNTIARNFWYFGDLIAPFDVDPAHVLSVNATTPTAVRFDFTPGGDFDWVASLDANVFLDASLQNVGAALDFSNSIVTSYDGPPGATTYSASGVFPTTLPLSEAPAPTKCPNPQGFWKNTPGAWPVSSLVLGSQTYTKAQLLTLLGSNGSDASRILAAQLIAAKLNVASGSSPTAVAATIASADTLLSGLSGALPYNIKTSSATGKTMTQLATTLESYNKRLLTPVCTP